MVIGTLAVDGWAVTFDTARRGLGGPDPSLLYQMYCAPINSQTISTSYYSMWHYNCFYTVKTCIFCRVIMVIW